MDEIGQQPKENDANYHVNKLPVEIVGRFLQKLSVGDRLKKEKVSPRWKQALSDWGWADQRKLNSNIVFERTTAGQRGKFTYQQLCSLLLDRVAGANLLELDLASFKCIDHTDFQRYPFPNVARIVDRLEKLEKLNISGFPLAAFVDFLPKSLRQITISGEIRMESLETLSRRCHDLEEVPFHHVRRINFGIVNGFLERFSRLKRLSLNGRIQSDGAIMSIGHLKVLEELSLPNFLYFDERAFQAMITGCQRLRKLSLWNINPFHQQQPLTLFDGALLCRLGELPNLTVLEVGEDREGAFTDAVLREIVKRGHLKGLQIGNSPTLTDDTVVYLVDRCKSLISLRVGGCPGITVRSLEAVVTEVQRRYGWPPRILHFDCSYTPIGQQIEALKRFKEKEKKREQRIHTNKFRNRSIFPIQQQQQPPVVEENAKKWIEMAAGNPWIRLYPTTVPDSVQRGYR